MVEQLNIIALISGGKDSFYSLYHCLQSGHKVVALGNLYPAISSHEATNHEELDEEHDLNSFMYQTVGHTVIPLYEEALGIPLYRQEIVGGAVQTGTSYGFTAAAGRDEIGSAEDETESLVPLLKRIVKAHPEANALSTGAILSTYQRTRIESVALRLGLVPLAYLWQYPILPPGSQISLLEDMEHVGLDARIVKVASGGLDESFLWANVADLVVRRRIERAMKRFGVDGDGAVLGEGGEFETLVVDGPDDLFKGRIVVKEKDRRVVREGGGSAWLKILSAVVDMKESRKESGQKRARFPDLLETRFQGVLGCLDSENTSTLSTDLDSLSTLSLSRSDPPRSRDSFVHWTITANGKFDAIDAEVSSIAAQIIELLQRESMKSSDIISTVIVLRSMSDFTGVNTIYGSLFTQPNPPSRVTISCGSAMPVGTNIIIHLKVQLSGPLLPSRKALHVQSRSYWAPANIGPYSQAISVPLPTTEDQGSPIWTVSTAGQIPLIPHTMQLPNSTQQSMGDFKLQAVLSLQHLWRIGRQMNVGWWTSCVAYIPSEPSLTDRLKAVSQKAIILSRAWSDLHSRPHESDEDESDEVDQRDLWEDRYMAGRENRGGESSEHLLPNHDMLILGKRSTKGEPPLWIAEVEELPRAAGVEWHAHTGISGEDGIVDISSYTGEGFTIHRTTFSTAVHSVVMIPYTVASAAFTSLSSAISILSQTQQSTTSYTDATLFALLDLSSSKLGGTIPCKSLWSRTGERLAAVLIYETL